MLDHISIGTPNLGAAKTFYDAVLAPLGLSCLYADDASLGYGAEAVFFWVLETPRAVAADADSGLHICFAAPARKAVKTFHAKALGAGGSDNGKPGLRADYGPDYFAAFVKDPDGYRLEAYCNVKD